MEITEFGIVKLSNELQLAKANNAIDVTELAMVRLSKELQPSKA